jgi:hypothetical protein
MPMIIERDGSPFGIMLPKLNDCRILLENYVHDFLQWHGEYKIAILPGGQKVNSPYFIEYVLLPLTEIYDPHGSETHERSIMLHFDNAPVHNPVEARESLANFGFKRMEHPPYTPDFAPCDFFLFGAMKRAFAG